MVLTIHSILLEHACPKNFFCNLEDILGGREYDGLLVGNSKKEIKVPYRVTSEGSRLAILDTLLGSRYLDTNSIVFIEPEGPAPRGGFATFGYR